MDYKIKNSIVVLCAALMLSACATNTDKYQEARAAAAAVPLFTLEAQEGQTIELKGVKRIAVANPSAGQGWEAPKNEWVSVANNFLGIAAGLGNTAILGKAAIEIAGSIKDAGVAGYQYVQAPTSSTSSTINVSNSGNTSSISDSNNTATSSSSTATTSTTTNTANPTTSVNGSYNPVTGK